MNRHYAGVAERAGHRCEYCHAPEAIFNLPFEVEHIVPTSRGGPDDESNRCLPAGPATSTSQINRTESIRRREKSSVSSARLRVRWEEHFRVEPEDGVIQSLTPVGRVTIACLRMNRDVQREARRSWMRLKLYP